MHNHNNNDGHKGMMWMMVICCAMPFVFLLFAGGTISLSGGDFWKVLIGAFILVHLWMMFKGHGGKNEK